LPRPICELAAGPGLSDTWSMPELTGHMLYFAYGEDLPRAWFTRLFPGAEWFGPARLEGHRLVPNAAGRANLRTEAGATVWGALWLVPAALLPALDANAGSGYERTTRRIVSPAGPCTEATLYVSTVPGESAPTLVELDTLLIGARENRLPAAYIKELSEMGGKS
jgi:gamma-glutamylcyclotransferase (GGCT)/AIG2-like uncharacterized protein YtfP